MERVFLWTIFLKFHRKFSNGFRSGMCAGNVIYLICCFRKKILSPLTRWIVVLENCFIKQIFYRWNEKISSDVYIHMSIDFRGNDCHFFWLFEGKATSRSTMTLDVYLLSSLHLCRGVGLLQRMCGIGHKTIWWWVSSDAEALGNAQHPLASIAPRSTLAQNGSSW